MSRPTFKNSLPAAACQRGVAIITALLVVALGTITMVAITTSQQLDMQRERNEGLIQQARSIGVGAERFAAALLYRDVQAELRGNSDSLDDDWAQTIPPIPVDNASIQGCVVDMQGRFNLNNLVDVEGNVRPVYALQLRRLLLELTIEETKADAIVDWVDEDIDFTGTDGAEDDYYTSLDPAYLTANAPFVSVSELQLVKGFSSAIEEEAADYELLLPHISALPVASEPTAVNVNTATPEVLASLSDAVKLVANQVSRWDTGAYEDYPECENIFDLTAEEPEQLVEGGEEDTTPFETSEAFVDELALEPDEEVTDVVYGVTSNYFQVRIDVEAEGITLSQYTLFERNDAGQTKVLYRSRDTL